MQQQGLPFFARSPNHVPRVARRTATATEKRANVNAPLASQVRSSAASLALCLESGRGGNESQPVPAHSRPDGALGQRPVMQALMPNCVHPSVAPPGPTCDERLVPACHSSLQPGTRPRVGFGVPRNCLCLRWVRWPRPTRHRPPYVQPQLGRTAATLLAQPPCLCMLGSASGCTVYTHWPQIEALYGSHALLGGAQWQNPTATARRRLRPHALP